MDAPDKNPRSMAGGRRGPTGRRRLRVGAAALVSLAGLIALGARPVSEEDAQVDSARAALEKWAETRRILSQEKRDWTLGREMLEERIELVRGEIASLRERLAEAESSIAEADEKRLELIEDSERLAQLSESLAGTVEVLEQRARDLLPRLPEPARERVRLFARRLPEVSAEAKQSLGERFQNVVAVANDVNKFNRDVTVTNEVRTLPDGTTAEVATLYVGLGQAYYVSGSGDVAGVGRATPDGWSWTPANAAAPNVREAIAILQEGRVAAFVPLPVRID